MMPYGHKRKDAWVDAMSDCPCCTTQYNKKRICRKTADARRRKAARRTAKQEALAQHD